MRFASQYWVYLIAIAAGLIAFVVWATKARSRALGRFAQKDLLKELLLQVDPRLQQLKIILLMSACFFCLFALARPQLGFQWQEVRRKGLDILVALDTSRSMLATDVKPNRLERSKLALRELTTKLKGDRIGLIAFAGSAFLECPLTVDYNGFFLALEDISVTTIPKGGTSLSSSIHEAIKSYAGGLKKYKILVIITDGEDHEGDPIQAAQEAAKEGIIIYCIGIGTQEGDLVFVDNEEGRKEYLKDSGGNAVKSKLNEDVLQKICLATGGTYVRATSTEFGLELLYNEKFSKMEKNELQAKMSKLYIERFQIPLALGLILLLLEMFVTDRRKEKR
jgi:Ca-activated chloride channel family protein